MSEAQNTQEENFEEQNIAPKDVNEKNSPEQTIESTQPQTQNSQQQIENMEVHKHPHHVTHKKKWAEYLLEFFMLFLAVFLGFLAENTIFGFERVTVYQVKHCGVSRVKFF